MSSENIIIFTQHSHPGGPASPENTGVGFRQYDINFLTRKTISYDTRRLFRPSPHCCHLWRPRSDHSGLLSWRMPGFHRRRVYRGTYRRVAVGKTCLTGPFRDPHPGRSFSYYLGYYRIGDFYTRHRTYPERPAQPVKRIFDKRPERVPYPLSASATLARPSSKLWGSYCNCRRAFSMRKPVLRGRLAAWENVEASARRIRSGFKLK